MFPVVNYAPLVLTAENLQTIATALQAAIEWMDSEQPPEAVMSHHGIVCTLPTAGVGISFGPGWDGWPVFIFSCPSYKPGEERTVYVHTRDTVRSLTVLVRDLVSVAHVWNGVSADEEGLTSFSVAIGRDFGAGVSRIFQNYRTAGVGVLHDDFWKKEWPDPVVPEGWR